MTPYVKDPRQSSVVASWISEMKLGINIGNRLIELTQLGTLNDGSTFATCPHWKCEGVTFLPCPETRTHLVEGCWSLSKASCTCGWSCWFDGAGWTITLYVEAPCGGVPSDVSLQHYQDLYIASECCSAPKNAWCVMLVRQLSRVWLPLRHIPSRIGWHVPLFLFG